MPPATLKFTQRSGNATKNDMAQAMDKSRTGPGFLAGRRFDEADALALADMGAHLDGDPLTAAQQP